MIMKVSLFLILISILLCGCLTTNITIHSEQSIIIENGSKLYFVPADTPVSIDLETGVMKVQEG